MARKFVRVYSTELITSKATIREVNSIKTDSVIA